MRKAFGADCTVLVELRLGDEEHAAQQRVQEYLPERGIGLHDVAQIGSVDFKACGGF